MKVDRGRPLHWFYLALFGLQAALGLAFRLLLQPLLRRAASGEVVLYGHKLNGNLLALHDHLRTDLRFKPVFLTMDWSYHCRLRADGIDSRWAGLPHCAALLGRAVALVSDHGLHSLELLQPLYRRTGLRFFDVWHGIPFKGFDGEDFQLQHRYDEVWVASELNRQLWIDRCGFDPDRVVVTGYARTDRLLASTENREQHRHRLGIPPGRVVLFAPTWVQDAEGRSIYPFGHDEARFLGALSTLAQRLDATILLRAHLNSDGGAGRGYRNILQMPASVYPDAESILLASDMMICDWSSIAFDFLLLERPVVFLNVPPPFRKGFLLGPEYRFGAVAENLEVLVEHVEMALEHPEQYWRLYRDRHQAIRERVYGEIADGKAAERCINRIESACLSS